MGVLLRTLMSLEELVEAYVQMTACITSMGCTRHQRMTTRTLFHIIHGGWLC